MTLDNMTGITKGSYTGGDLFCKSQLITCNRVNECNGVCPFEDALRHADKAHEAIDLAIEALSAETVHGYTEWLEKNIVEAETFEWLCEDTTDEEWCEKNCKYSSIQAECLRHLYEVSKGGDRWEV